MNSEIIMYQTEDGLTKIEATFDKDTVWLSIDQMAELFQRDKSTISRHIKNIFNEGELIRNSVVAKFATTATDFFLKQFKTKCIGQPMGKLLPRRFSILQMQKNIKWECLALKVKDLLWRMH